MSPRLVLAALPAVALLAGAQPASAATVLARSVIGAGGASWSTLGQPAVGVSGNGGMRAYHGFWRGAPLVATSAGPPALPPLASLPAEFSFGLPAPNPARGPVGFSLALPRDARVRLSIVDVRGRLVAVPADGACAAGSHRLTWDGRGASGVYYARLAVDGRVVGKRSFVRLR